MRDKSIAKPFILLTVGITWILWWSIVIANKYNYLKYGTPVMMFLYIIGGNTKPIVSIILLLKSKQITGKELIKKIFDFKQSLYLYFIVFISLAISYIIPILMGTSYFVAPIYLAILSIPVMIIGGGLEEIGWRMILQPNLENKMNFTFATLLTGVIWSLWHLPLFFMKGTNQFNWSFGAFAITVIGISFILAAIYKISNSIYLCILFHTIWNTLGECIETESNIVSSSITTIALIGISYMSIILSKKLSIKKESNIYQ